MSPFDQARAIFKAVRGNPAAIKAQNDAFAALATSISSPNGGIQITSSQVNGQSFNATHSSNAQERFQVLSILMTMIENNTAGSKSVVGRFA